MRLQTYAFKFFLTFSIFFQTFISSLHGRRPYTPLTAEV